MTSIFIHLSLQHTSLWMASCDIYCFMQNVVGKKLENLFIFIRFNIFIRFWPKNRRCLCELAKQIGFVDKAREAFNLEGQIASYMHLVRYQNCIFIIHKVDIMYFWIEQQPEVVKRDIRFARQLRIASKVKVPFPHCLSGRDSAFELYINDIHTNSFWNCSVVMRDVQSNSFQMLTQGTADIVLDCCEDYWDGKDLRPLGSQERKRAQVIIFHYATKTSNR